MLRFNALRMKRFKIIMAVIGINIVLSGFSFAQSQAGQFSLLLQQTPPNGGTVTPGVGVHNLNCDSEVTLTARPKSGYRFVYWLGDVSDPSSNQAIAYLDSPKIIVAVFERTKYEYLSPAEMMQSAPIGGLRGHGADYSKTQASSAGGKRPHKYHPPTYEPPEPPEFDPPPVPEEDVNDEVPVPVPEPATVCLLALGGLAMFRRNSKSKFKL